MSFWFFSRGKLTMRSTLNVLGLSKELLIVGMYFYISMSQTFENISQSVYVF